jgi:2-polyprenyl-3-methyl-5-hydroxy-6-metoxy-1,4-benzoquinol methylase
VLGELMFAPKLNIDIDVDREMLEIMISHIRKVWAEYGKSEPYWSVLTANDYKRENISLNMKRFNDSGKAEVEGLESIILRNDIDIDKLKICLEYGCGVGRVTRWLAMRFEHVFALDISPSHLQIAKKYLYDNELSNVEFIQMESLKTIDTIKKVHILYSTLVLQHNPPPIIAYIIRKLLKLVDKRGIAVFQIPTYIKGYQFPAEEYIKHIKKHKEMELHVLPQKKIFQIAEEEGCSVIEVIRYSATDSVDHISNLFVMQKR